MISSQVGSGSPAQRVKGSVKGSGSSAQRVKGSGSQRVNPFPPPLTAPVPDLQLGGKISGEGNKESLLTRIRMPGSANRVGISGFRRRLTGKRRQQQGGKLSSGKRKLERIPPPRIPPKKNPNPTAQAFPFPPRINTPRNPVKIFVRRPESLDKKATQSQTPTQRPRLPTGTRTRPGSKRPGPATPRPRPPLQQPSRATISKVTDGRKKSSSSSSKKTTSRKGLKVRLDQNNETLCSDVKATDLYPLAGYKNTAGSLLHNIQILFMY